MIEAHRQALEALLAADEASPDVELSVHVTRAGANATLPYVVLHPGQGTAEATSLHGLSDWREWPFQTTAVGSDPEEAQWAAEQAEARLLDRRPQVDGRSTGRIRKSLSFPVVVDRDAPKPVYLARDTWTFSSTPA